MTHIVDLSSKTITARNGASKLFIRVVVLHFIFRHFAIDIIDSSSSNSRFNKEKKKKKKNSGCWCWKGGTRNE